MDSFTTTHRPEFSSLLDIGRVAGNMTDALLAAGLNATTTMAVTTAALNESTNTSMNFWQKFNHHYKDVHGYFALIMCIFGTVSNILNIIVLTRKRMHSPTNFILTALAISDILTMMPYMFYISYLNIFTQQECALESDYPYYHQEAWMVVTLVNHLLVITAHCVAMWLTVALAVFRYIFVCKYQKAPTMCSMQRAKITVLAVYCTSIMLCIPHYLNYRVINVNLKPDGKPCYEIDHTELVYSSPVYQIVVSWVYGVVNKIVPCLIMACLSALLVIAMQKAKRRRARLLNVSSTGDHGNSSHEHDRTTYMLVAVVISFIITEVPQGILAWISGISQDFATKVYYNMGDLMDILVLVNSSVNFIVYCAMSQQFRDTFKSLFVTKNVPQFFSRAKQQPNGAEYSSMVKASETNV